MYLICKQAVTNALRHGSPAEPITVTLAATTTRLTLAVTNAVQATTSPTRAVQGMRNIRHRAKLIGAVLTVGPAEMGGEWRIQLSVRW